MESECFCVYPIHLDATRSISKGRKYPKSFCINNPSYSEIVRAMKKLELECIEEPTKKHPREHFVYGRLRIKKMYGKRYVLEGIKHAILNEREDAAKEKKKYVVETKKPTKGYIKNEMNLVPRRKKKGKKNK
jgi:signal recognition particle subunit SRP19